MDTSVDFFTNLYSLYSDKIYNLAFQMTGDDDLSHDIKQETFEKVLENLANFRFESDVYTWVYAIAKNLCLKHIGENSRKSFAILEQLIESHINGSGQGGYDAHEKSFYITQVKDGCLLGVLRCLSFYQRIAFIFYIILEVPLKDVSEILQKSENATRILIHRARRRIRNFLCNNCSLYNQQNRCKCENLISFSLKQSWIERYNPSIEIKMIESEIKALKDEVLLYRSIKFETDQQPLSVRLSKKLKKGELKIFYPGKVK